MVRMRVPYRNVRACARWEPGILLSGCYPYGKGLYSYYQKWYVCLVFCMDLRSASDSDVCTEEWQG